MGPTAGSCLRGERGRGKLPKRRTPSPPGSWCAPLRATPPPDPGLFGPQGRSTSRFPPGRGRKVGWAGRAPPSPPPATQPGGPESGTLWPRQGPAPRAHCGHVGGAVPPPPPPRPPRGPPESPPTAPGLGEIPGGPLGLGHAPSPPPPPSVPGLPVWRGPRPAGAGGCQHPRLALSPEPDKSPRGLAPPIPAGTLNLPPGSPVSTFLRDAASKPVKSPDRVGGCGWR